MNRLATVLGLCLLALTASPLASAASDAVEGGVGIDQTNLLGIVCVDTGATCGPYGNAWVSAGPVTIRSWIADVRVCATSHTSNLLC